MASYIRVLYTHAYISPLVNKKVTLCYGRAQALEVDPGVCPGPFACSLSDLQDVVSSFLR